MMSSQRKRTSWLPSSTTPAIYVESEEGIQTAERRGEFSFPRGRKKRSDEETGKEANYQGKRERQGKEVGKTVAAVISNDEVEELIDTALSAAKKGEEELSHDMFHRTVSRLLDGTLCDEAKGSFTLHSLGGAIHSILMLCETSSANRPLVSVIFSHFRYQNGERACPMDTNF